MGNSGRSRVLWRAISTQPHAGPDTVIVQGRASGAIAGAVAGLGAAEVARRELSAASPYYKCPGPSGGSPRPPGAIVSVSALGCPP